MITAAMFSLKLRGITMAWFSLSVLSIWSPSSSLPIMALSAPASSFATATVMPFVLPYGFQKPMMLNQA